MSAAMPVSLRRRRLVVGLSLPFVASPAWAAVDRPTAEALLRISGLWAQLADVASQARADALGGLNQRGAASTQAEVERLSQAIASAYSAQRLRSACLDATSKNLEKAHVAALRRWYEGSPGSAIVRLEVAHSAQDPRVVLEQGAAMLARMPSSRRRVLEEVVVGTRAAELQTELAINTSLALGQGARAARDPTAPSVGELKAALAAQRHQIMRAAGAQSLVAFASTYASLRDADLDTYVNFLKSPAGRHFVDVAIHALGAAIFGAALDFGRALGGARAPARGT
jgi:hypothetical protein